MIKHILDENKEIRKNSREMNKLKEFFPSCFDGKGHFDLTKFKEEISDKVDFTQESYRLDFLGKSYAKYISSLETETVLEPDLEHNQKFENANSENLYITGDNLDALKHLLKSYAGKIKCIYIDPPYNTGSDDFVYQDNFQFTSEKLVEVLDIEEDEAERIINMTSKGSASHSAWLTFMYPRLNLAKRLLKDDGVVFISIDDNEQAQLKMLGDEIFGAENFVTNISWHKNYASSNDSKAFSSVLDYILVFRKGELFQRNLLPRGYKQDSLYKYDSDDGKGLWRSDNLSVKSYTKDYDFPIVNPNTQVQYFPPKGRCWVTNKAKIREWIQEGRIFLGNLVMVHHN